MKQSTNRGFTLVELMVTIAIVGIVSAIAIPNMIGWRAERTLRGAINNMQADMQLARMRAIREAEVVAVVFNPGTRSYRIWVDANKNWALDPGEQELRSVTLPVGVTFSGNPFGANQRTRFTSKGMPEAFMNGSVTLQNNSPTPLRLVLSKVGRLRIENG